MTESKLVCYLICHSDFTLLLMYALSFHGWMMLVYRCIVCGAHTFSEKGMRDGERIRKGMRDRERVRKSMRDGERVKMA